MSFQLKEVTHFIGTLALSFLLNLNFFKLKMKWLKHCSLQSWNVNPTSQRLTVEKSKYTHKLSRGQCTLEWQEKDLLRLSCWTPTVELSRCKRKKKQQKQSRIASWQASSTLQITWNFILKCCFPIQLFKWLWVGAKINGQDAKPLCQASQSIIVI